MTKDEKQFLKWLFIAALLGVVIWRLTEYRILGIPGAGVTLVIFAVGFYRRFHPKAASEQHRAENIAHTALQRKFGRWTFAAKYGPLVLLVLGCWVLNRYGTAGPRWTLGNWSGTWGFLAFAASFGFFVLWGLYLCYLVADYKAEQKGEV